jgi:hypothetical protein
MILEVFQNGSDKVNRRLLLFELLCDIWLVVSAFISASLPDQQWVKLIPHHELWIPLFLWLNGLAAVAVKGVQMFFSKAAALYQKTKEEIHSADTETISKEQNKP